MRNSFQMTFRAGFFPFFALHVAWWGAQHRLMQWPYITLNRAIGLYRPSRDRNAHVAAAARPIVWGQVEASRVVDLECRPAAVAYLLEPRCQRCVPSPHLPPLARFHGRVCMSVRGLPVQKNHPKPSPSSRKMRAICLRLSGT